MQVMPHSCLPHDFWSSQYEYHFWLRPIALHRISFFAPFSPSKLVGCQCFWPRDLSSVTWGGPMVDMP